MAFKLDMLLCSQIKSGVLFIFVSPEFPGKYQDMFFPPRSLIREYNTELTGIVFPVRLASLVEQQEM